MRFKYLNVSSNGMLEQKHSHIGFICLTFLHCAFWNVSSKHQLKKMQSYIGCNCAWHCELCTALWIVRGIVNCARHCALTIVGRGYGLITKAQQFRKFSGIVRSQLCVALCAHNCLRHCALTIVCGVVNCVRQCALTIVRGIVNCVRQCALTMEEVMSQLIENHVWLTRVGIELLGQLKKWAGPVGRYGR